MTKKHLLFVDTFPVYLLSKIIPTWLEPNLADTDPSSSVIEFDESDLNKALEHINVYKSPGPDGIHPRILYETRNIITAPLKKILETSLLLK